MTDKPEKSLEAVVREDGRYPLEAFVFLQEGLARAANDAYGDEAEPERPRHVSGRQLCEALRAEALERWGLLGRSVLARWNIHATIDFGHMVYLLVDNGHMYKTDEDSVEDFRDVYDFKQAFGPAQVFNTEP